MAILTPNLTATVEDLIDCGDTISVSYNSLSLQNLSPDGEVSIVMFNVLDDYFDEIYEQSTLYEFKYEEYQKYYQAPKLLSNYLYGTTELDFIIMRINGIYDPKDFVMRRVRILTKQRMTDILSQIYNANKKFINEYNERNNE